METNQTGIADSTGEQVTTPEPVPEDEVILPPHKKIFFHARKPLLVALIIGLLLLIAIPVFTYFYFARDFSSKETFLTKKNAGVILLDRTNKPFFTFYEAESKKTVPLSAIAPIMQQAVIAIEDKDFYTHQGFSLRGIGRAVMTNIAKDSLSQGGSTLSQQLIKNTLLSQEKSFLRKYQELVLAIELERRFDKKEILEMYLNTVYFGEGAFGVEDAAHTYFNTSANKLTLAQASMLAGILPAPSALSPLSGNSTRAEERQQLVLSEMRKQKYITAEQEAKAKKEKIAYSPQADGLNQIAPHFALMVKDALTETYGEQTIAQSGYTVKTTLDLEKQQFAEKTVKNQVQRLQANKVTNGAAVVLDPRTGEILSLVGSWDWHAETNGKINMALKSRQPGSSFKPIVYAAAFEKRVLTPGSIIEDKEMTFPGGYKPKNYDEKFRGNVTVRRALANSLNIPALVALQRTGIPSVLDMSERLGITTLDSTKDYGLSLALGSAEVPLLEMAESFSVFANRGVKNKPFTILEIRDKNKNIVSKTTETSEEVLDSDVAFLISSILSDNPARGEIFGNSLTLSRPAAVKTGTTEDYRDSLTVGYTPNLTVAVWIGNNDNKPMDGIAGSMGAGPIWRTIMEHFFIGTPVQTFLQTPGVKKQNICREKGLKVDDAVSTTSAYMEFFLRGTEPTQDCGLNPTPTITPIETTKDEPKPTDTPSQPTALPTFMPTALPSPTKNNSKPTLAPTLPLPTDTIITPEPTVLPT